MEPIPKSGHYYCNKFVYLALTAFEDVMGKNGLNAILNLAHLPHLIDNFPPDNLERGFDFADFSALNTALEEMYGPRGGRGLALRAGRAVFDGALRNFGALAGVGDLAFRVLPLHTKMRVGLPSMAKIFSQLSDQLSTVEERENEFIYTIHLCPVCWGRPKVDKPVCYIANGLIVGSLHWVSGGHEFRVTETKCVAMGDPTCEFHIPKQPLS
jgi:predicted hydrocarbon binding protein